MTLNEMKTNVIRKWGFEHPATLYFFDAVEHETDEFLWAIAYEFAMAWENLDEVFNETLNLDED